MAGGEVMPFKRFILLSIGYLMLSMLLSIIVGEQSHEAGVRSLLDVSPALNFLYAGLKLLMAAAYMWTLRNTLTEIAGILAFALLVRYFAEGTFTIALIGAMMARRMLAQTEGL